MFYADLHIHSRYSRATSRDCDLPHLDLWARQKGDHPGGDRGFHPSRLAPGASGSSLSRRKRAFTG